MSRWRRVVCAAAVVLIPTPVVGDGMFVKSEAARADVAEPNQKALICWDGKREILVLQVTYRGGAGRFGWVVPVPARPKVDVASGDLFLELARLTAPIVREQRTRMAATGSRGAQRAEALVEVIERVEVGPYDATVLAASDATALAEWLRKNGYVMPEKAPQVLDPYVKRKWYYVALHIKTERDLLSAFRRVLPSLKTVKEAPVRLATEVVRVNAYEPWVGVSRSERLATEIAKIATEVSGVSEAYGGGRLGEGRVGLLAHDLEDLRKALEGMERELVQREVLRNCVSQCGGHFGLTKLRSAARAVGLEAKGEETEVVAEVVGSVLRDLCRDVSYDGSRLARLQVRMDPARAAARSQAELEMSYELVREALRKARPLPLDEGQRGDFEEAVSRANLPGGRFAPLIIYDVVTARDVLYEDTKRAVEETIRAAGTALASGTLRPLRLDFDTAEMVYPLRISSLNPGKTDVQLYTLTDHRMTAKGFGTDFAGRLEGETFDRRNYQALAGFVMPARSYLTELRADMTPQQMTADLSFSRAWRDWAYRKREGWPLLTPREQALLALLLGAVVTLVVMRRRYRRRLREVKTSSEAG